MAPPKKTPEMKIAELKDSLTYVQEKYDMMEQRWKGAAARVADLERQLKAAQVEVARLNADLAGREKGTLRTVLEVFVETGVIAKNANVGTWKVAS